MKRLKRVTSNVFITLPSEGSAELTIHDISVSWLSRVFLESFSAACNEVAPYRRDAAVPRLILTGQQMAAMRRPTGPSLQKCLIQRLRQVGRPKIAAAVSGACCQTSECASAGLGA